MTFQLQNSSFRLVSFSDITANFSVQTVEILTSWMKCDIFFLGREDWLTYLLTYLLTYSTEHSPSWEANRFSPSQEIPRILWNPKVNYRIHKCPPPVPTLSQIDLVHSPKSHFLKINPNVSLQSSPGTSKWPPSLRFPLRNPAYTSPLPHTCYMLRPYHSSRFDHTNNIAWGGKEDLTLK